MALPVDIGGFLIIARTHTASVRRLEAVSLQRHHSSADRDVDARGSSILDANAQLVGSRRYFFRQDRVNLMSLASRSRNRLHTQFHLVKEHFDIVSICVFREAEHPHTDN